jgi:hypothetical protein
VSVADLVREVADKLIWAVPKAKISATQRTKMQELVTHAFWGCVAAQSVPTGGPTTKQAVKQALRYVSALRPPSLRQFSLVVRRFPSQHQDTLQVLREVSRALIPEVGAAIREWKELDLAATTEDPKKHLVESLRKRLAQVAAQEPKAVWIRSAAPHVRPGVLFVGSEPRKPFEVARALAGAALGLSLGQERLAQLLRPRRQASWRIPEWETAEARQIAKQIEPA